MTGEQPAAETLHALRAAAAARPRDAEAQDRLGVALLEAGRLQDAVRALRRAAELAPRWAVAQAHLGLALDRAGDGQAALRALKRAVDLAPDVPDLHYNLANVLRARGKTAEAIAAYRQALALDPFDLGAANNLALALRDAGDPLAALATLREALARAPAGEPRAAQLWNSLGNIRDALAGEADAEARREAIDAYRRALALAPDRAIYHFNLAAALQRADDQDAAALHFARAYELDPALVAKGGADLLPMLYAVAEPLAFRTAAERFCARAFAFPAPAPHANAPDPDRRLRMGYVSGDFREHSVARFLEPVLAAHDRDRVEVFCYRTVVAEDATAQRLRALGHAWRDVGALDDRALAALVRADAIDILVDLSGHTQGHRLGAFALRPAPVQASWIGFAATTGLDAIGWRITDAIADPPGASDAHGSERLMRLPGCFLCYRPSDAAPGISALPAVASGRVTFGSFNHAAKLRAPVVRAWAELLRRVPQARLLVKSRGIADPMVRQDYRRLFAEQGIRPERLEFADWTAGVESHLAHYARVDVALDTFPYNGTTTTCEALWQGVPVVSLAGGVHRARVGASLLAAAGCADWVADTPERYVEIAAALAGDVQRLAVTRAGLRGRLRRSALLDAGAFTRGLEDAYRAMWRAWCEGAAKSG